MRALVVLALLGCGTPARVEPPGVPRAIVLRGGRLMDGRVVDLVVGADGRLMAGPAPAGATSVALDGKWIIPGFIDSHVHLAYLPAEESLPRGGVVAAVDLAAPVGFLERIHDGRLGPIRILAAGPMLTAPGGYPLASWGKDGYGLACADPACAAASVEMLNGRGARVIKLAMGKPPALDEPTLRAAVARAHQRELKVAAHALRDADARLAASVGADLLAHTPIEPLSAATLSAWRGRAVISTIAAFGAEPTAIANLTALRGGGVVVLYGTDLGNSQVTRIDPEEIGHLVTAGLDGVAIVDAGTRVPAEYWGFSELGSLEPGKEASLLVLDANPQVDPQAIARPVRVMLRGTWLK